MSEILLDRATEMNIRSKEWNGANLLEVPVPGRTSSYSPVSHLYLIESMGEMLASRNLSAKDVQYNIGREGNQLIGKITLDNSDEVMGNTIVFRNSYDKSMSVAAVCGTNVWICSNGMIGGEANIKFVRKHTGDVKNDVIGKFREALNDMNRNFDEMKEFERFSKQIGMGDKKMAAHFGVMGLEGILRPTQLNGAIREIRGSEHFKGKSVWDAYNHCTEVLKGSSPTEYMKSHSEVHKYWQPMIDKFNA